MARKAKVFRKTKETSISAEKTNQTIQTLCLIEEKHPVSTC